jgi:23S rRNA (pseudouridine1915-N3)-methyltransferase
LNITLIAVGKRMPDWVESGYAEYAKRLIHEVNWRLVEIPMGRRVKGADLQKLAQKEGEQMLAAVPAGDKVIALSERGQCFDTGKLAAKLETLKTAGDNISFLIGGPEGLSAQCLAKADQKWSLSLLTFPHPLVRVIVTEQIYRAFTILNHHPYHR